MVVDPQRALVQPRARVVGSPGRRYDTTEALPVLDALEPILAGVDEGVIGVIGPVGRGKTTILRHLAAVLPTGRRVRFVDDPGPTDRGLLDPAPGEVVIYSARQQMVSKQIARLEPQAWARDEHVEYLLASARPRCAEVLARLERAADLSTISGNPELTRIVLDQMVGNPQVDSVAEALEVATWKVFGDGPAREQARALVVEAVLRNRTPELPDSGWGMVRALHHRPVQLLLAAEYLVEDIARGSFAAFYAPLEPDVIEALARRLRGQPDARAALERTFETSLTDAQPMIASTLIMVDPAWRPPPRPGLCFRGAYLPGARWRGVRLPKADFRYALLHGADLSEAMLEGCKFTSALAGGVSFERAHLAGATFTSARLEGARFEGATLVGANLTGLDLSVARFQGAILRHARLVGANLEGLLLPGIDLEGADLTGAYLTGASMPGANLRRTCLCGAALAEVDWQGADLSGADLRQCTFHMGSSRSGLVGSPIACEGSRTGFYTDEAAVEHHYLPPEEIRKANLRGAKLAGANIDGVDFYLVDLRDVHATAEQRAIFRLGKAIVSRPAERA